MADKQHTEWKNTRFDGVDQRASRTKKYEGKPDITYSIDYYDLHSEKRGRKPLETVAKGSPPNTPTLCG